MTDVLGWAGSALLVYSLLQTRVLRFRVLNLVAALVLVMFNAIVAVWPMAAVNLAIAAINSWHIARLLRTRHDGRHYDVVPIGPDEAYLRHLLHRHRDDIERFNPGALAAGRPVGLTGAPDDDQAALLDGDELTRSDGADGSDGGDPVDRLAFLVLSGAETVGVVLAHRTAPGVARLDLDYVLPRYRDFTPGEFVYRPDGPFARAGITRVLAPRRMRDADDYLHRVGFTPHDNDLALDLA